MKCQKKPYNGGLSEVSVQHCSVLGHVPRWIHQLLHVLVHSHTHTVNSTRATKSLSNWPRFQVTTGPQSGSVAEWLACGTQAQKVLSSNRSRDAVG